MASGPLGTPGPVTIVHVVLGTQSGLPGGASGLSQSRVKTVMALTGVCASVQVLLLNVKSEAQLAGRGMLCGLDRHSGQPGGSRAWTCGLGVVSASFNYPGCQGNHSLSGTIWGDKEALWKVPSRSG